MKTVLTPSQEELFRAIHQRCQVDGTAHCLFQIGVVTAGQSYVVAYRNLKAMAGLGVVQVSKQRNGRGQPLVIRPLIELKQAQIREK